LVVRGGLNSVILWRRPQDDGAADSLRDKMRIIIFLLSVLFSASVYAKPAPEIPYYASIKADKANIRTGPSVRYPIQWIYNKADWPVKVTATFETWRKISDIKGEVGWIHESILSGKRYVIINTNGVQEIYRLPIPTSSVVLIAESGVIGELISCKSGWCKIKVASEKGWVEEKKLWGVEENEVYK
jgi:SH3-like domain-containing protein